MKNIYLDGVAVVDKETPVSLTFSLCLLFSENGLETYIQVDSQCAR